MGTSQNGRTYSLRAVVRSTGLTEHTLRAWERRHGVVTPERTPGGTRRYSESEVARLSLLRAGVAAGHPIRELARLPSGELQSLLKGGAPHAAADGSLAIEELLEAVARYDAGQLERLLTLRFHALGPSAFARLVVAPLLREIGERWERGELAIAAEHIATSMIRGILGVALRANPAARHQPPILFCTPAGDRHEFGALIAAVTSVAAGGNVVFLGADVPVEDLANAARQLGAAAIALSIVLLDRGAGARYLRALRTEVGADTEIWLGGAAAATLAEIPGVEPIGSLEELERRVELLAHASR
jgi:DNA-binding transcriptional MerR regulator/methylmalonyl-CoA mutase cobalamin-binding subunit